MFHTWCVYSMTPNVVLFWASENSHTPDSPVRALIMRGHIAGWPAQVFHKVHFKCYHFHCSFCNTICFAGWGSWFCAQPQPGGPGTILFWPFVLALSGLVEPTGSLDPHRHSSWVHQDTQAYPPRQGNVCVETFSVHNVHLIVMGSI